MNSNNTIQLLSRLGVCPAYKGYPYLVHSIGIAAARYHSGFPPLKELYEQTARHYHVSASIVAHDIRTVLRSYWNQNNAERFTCTIGYPVQDMLTIKEFISVVAEFIVCQENPLP